MKSQVLLQKLLWPYCLCPWKIRQKIEMSLVAHLSRAENWPFFTKIGRTYTIICLSGLSERNSAPRILISRKFHFLHHHVRFLIYFFRNLAPNSLVISKVLEPVCCKKQQKKVPDQLQVCGIGDLWRTWMIPNWLYIYESKWFPWSYYTTLQMFCLLKSQTYACKPNPKTTSSNFNR